MQYPPDSRKYKRYKIDGRYYVQCLEVKTINGINMVCSFQNKREDKVKKNIKDGKLHVCKFVQKNPNSNSLLRYLSTNNEVEIDDFTEDKLRLRFAYLIGKKKHFDRYRCKY